ncbi:MAG: glycosyltransferase [Planctomycetota bacterium]|nr:glycosyltransferase [Planctomycetota bacterium]
MDPRTPQFPSAPGIRATIVLVLHDQQHLVVDALGSLLDQEGVPCRILVIDDGSVDRTWNRIARVLDHRTDHPHEVRTERYVNRLGPRRLINAISSIDTEIAIVAQPDDRSRSDRAERLIHALDSTGASVAVSERTRAGGSVLEHLSESRRRGSGPMSSREIVFQVASLPTNLGTMALRPHVIHGFPELSEARHADELGAMLAFRGSLLGGCYFLEETLVDFKRTVDSMTIDYRSRETCRELLFADLLSTRVAMLQDLRSLPPSSEGNDSSRIRLEASLKGVLVELSERWAQAREELWVRDLRPTWLTSEQSRSLEAAPPAESRTPLFRRLAGLCFGAGAARTAA